MNEHDDANEADPVVDLFARFLEGGGRTSLEFEAFREGHPEHAAALGRAWTNFQQLEGMFDGDEPRAETRLDLTAASADVLDRLRERSHPSQRYASGAGEARSEFEEVGRGGMGAVLRAFDVDLRRDLAMKVLSANDSARTDDRARRLRRFLDEAQITGQLEHPGVVPVHELGVDEDGRIYFTMRLIRGRDLGEILGLVRAGSREWNRTRVLSDLLRVCETMAFAHTRGVVHRDLKPANVMVGEFGETYVMDWGLATVVGRESTEDGRGVETDDADQRAARLTGDGVVLGTPPYMSPEQALGDVELDARSDVYSVGAMLYHLLAGHAPYLDGDTGASSASVIARLVAGPPRALEALGSDAPGELVAICERAMARTPSERYADMGEMAGDLRNYLEGRVVRAYETGAVAEFKKWVRRNRRTAALIAVILVVAFAGLASTLYVESRSNEALAAKNDELAELNDELGSLNVELDGARREAEAEAERANDNAERATRSEERALAGEESARLEAERVLRLADLTRLSVLRERFDALYPVRPEKAREIEAWLREANELTGRLELHRTTLAALRTTAIPRDEIADLDSLPERPHQEELSLFRDWHAAHERILREGTWTGDYDMPFIEANKQLLADGIERMETDLEYWRPWRFESVEKQWEHDQLTRLIVGLEEDFVSGALVARMEERQVAAATLAERTVTGDDAARRWAEAVGSIAELPAYGGLLLEPQVGLLPVGRDPDSGLWEFVDLVTGTDVQRDGDGRLSITEATGVVFVLLPGGAFALGASAEEPPNLDPDAMALERPVHPVSLDPFFVGKNEITQGQWLRFTGENPSLLRPGVQWPEALSLLHPVESITWADADRTLRNMGFALPTEAQWEYAARAGTTTPWWTGEVKESLVGAANLLDSTSIGITPDPSQVIERWLADGRVVHAPTGSFAPNPFGLHNVHGNVAEWCADVAGDYGMPIWPGTGRRFDSESPFRILRGGDFDMGVQQARSAYRGRQTPDEASHRFGVRAARAIE